MADKLQAMMAGQTSSGMVQLAGGVEHIERIKPQPAPPPCPPGQAPVPCPPVDTNAPMGPPVSVHEPAPGERAIIEVIPNQPLIFDFNPLDLKASQHDGSVVLTFPDGAQIELHDIVGPCGVQPTPFQLPDGTVITPGDLLQAFHLEVLGPCGLVAPTPIVPHHEVPNTGFAVSPFEIGELGPGLYGLGPLWPTGFGYGTEFLHGTGGSHFAPPGPPGPPGPPPPPPVGSFTVIDQATEHYFLGTTAPPPTNVGGTDYTIPVSGNYISEAVTASPTSPPVTVEGYNTVPALFTFGSHAAAGAPLTGEFGTLTISSAGDYQYTLSAASEHTLSQLGTDLMSQAVNGIYVNPPNNIFTTGFQDNFDVVTTNGPDTFGNNALTDIKEITFDFFAADVQSSAAATIVGVTGTPTTELLLTYTDLVDPAHSFQQLVNIVGGTATPVDVSTTTVQPNDPALVTFEYLSGDTAQVSSLSVEGSSITGLTPVGPLGTHAVTAVINPTLDQLGDPGDNGSMDNIGASQDSAANPAPLTITSAYTDALSGQSGASGYLYDTNTGSADVMMSGGTTATADVLNFDGTPGTASTTIDGSTSQNAANVIDWSSAAEINTTSGLTIDGSGGNVVNPGLNVLEIESANGQTLNFSNQTSLTTFTENAGFAAGSNVLNIDVIDLTDAANTNPANISIAPANSVTLSADDVFNLAQNEPAAIQSAGGAVALWILGNSNDSVTLAGTGMTWSQISPQVTSVNQSGGNPTQMVGFTEYSATAPTSGATVHVYVANAIAQVAGHVAHA